MNGIGRNQKSVVSPQMAATDQLPKDGLKEGREIIDTVNVSSRRRKRMKR